MIKKKSRQEVRIKKRRRIRGRLRGSANRPRLAVYRSNEHMYAQIIDDDAANTLTSASTLEKEVKAKLKSTSDTEAASYLGELIAKRALDKGITTVVYDRGGFIYHGRIAALADGARKAGLEF